MSGAELYGVLVILSELLTESGAPVCVRRTRDAEPSDRQDSPRRLIEQLRDKQRAKAVEARQWATELPDWDGANRHELRNRAGVYDNCADDLEALIAALPSSEEPTAQVYDVCSQCGVMRPCGAHPQDRGVGVDSEGRTFDPARATHTTSDPARLRTLADEADERVKELEREWDLVPGCNGFAKITFGDGTSVFQCAICQHKDPPNHSDACLWLDVSQALVQFRAASTALREAAASLETLKLERDMFAELAEPKRCAGHPDSPRLDGCDECVMGNIFKARAAQEVAEAERDAALSLLPDIGGALLDAGTVPVGDISTYVGAIHALIAERDAALAQVALLTRTVTMLTETMGEKKETANG